MAGEYSTRIPGHTYCMHSLPLARCKSSLRSLQMPYVRATNKFDFGCLFLATWMDALAAMCACAALARTLSACLDAMTGGLARILILGMTNSIRRHCKWVVQFLLHTFRPQCTCQRTVARCAWRCRCLSGHWHVHAGSRGESTYNIYWL